MILIQQRFMILMLLLFLLVCGITKCEGNALHPLLVRGRFPIVLPFQREDYFYSETLFALHRFLADPSKQTKAVKQ